MITVTCKLSNGDVSTGIRWVMGGLEPLIICTSSTNPVMSRPAGRAISYFRIKSRVMTQMLSASKFMESKLPAMGTCPPAIQRKMNKVAKKTPNRVIHTAATVRIGL